MLLKKIWPWAGAAIATAGAALVLAMRLWGDDRTMFLPGAMTDGHHQIEQDCDACHAPFLGVKQDACLNCHGEELEAVDDSHPRAKFEDPRNADRLKALDARFCITCHVEHRPDRTRAMGVTRANDLCFYCHAEIAKERKTHAGLGFDGCASSGCHNYHDNTALFEDFLLAHRNEPDVKPAPRQPKRNLRSIMRAAGKMGAPLSLAQANGPASIDRKLGDDWARTAHAAAGVNCRDCHVPKTPVNPGAIWTDHPDESMCADCHARENAGFVAGRHGMRLARGLSPLRVADARLPMQSDAAHRTLVCTSCHGAHRFDTRFAAAEACAGCHDDRHTRAYADSPHARLWRDELAARGSPGSGVSCAACHLPRETVRDGGESVVRVEHNQNANLRPGDKMLRSSCMHCHGLGFSIDALGDAALVARNFNGRPAHHIESIDMASRHDLESSKTRRKSP
jgi:predicted CXXCH cytochrome family protein